MTFSQKLDAALDRLNAHSRAMGVKPETTAYYATGHSRLLDAMRRKAASLDAQIDRINRYLDKPPEK